MMDWIKSLAEFAGVGEDAAVADIAAASVLVVFPLPLREKVG